MTTPISEIKAEQCSIAPHSKKKKVLSAIFNMAVGAGATALAKTAVASAMITCPPLSILLATAFAVGTVMTVVCHEGKRYQAKKVSGSAPCYFGTQNFKDIFSKQNAKDFFLSEQNAKVFAKSTFFALAGGALFLGFHDGVIQDAFHKLFGSTPSPAATLPPVHTAVAAPIHTAPPVQVDCQSPVDHFKSLTAGHHVSARVQDALHRIASHNPRVHAQAIKDLAFFSFNGLDGVPKDMTLANQLFHDAAQQHNWQAIRDLKYVSHFKIAAPLPCR